MRPPLLLLLVLLPHLALASPRGDEASARAALLARFDAALHADVGTLEKLLADDLEYCGVSATCSTKAQYLDSVRSGTRDYISSVATIETVRIFGDVGVIRGKAKVTVGGKDRQPQDLHIGYTDIWIWKDGRWQMTAWRSARLPDSPVK